MIFKVTNKIFFLFILSSIILISGCKKYDDGPSISFLTKTQRLTGDWEVKEWIVDNIDQIGYSINYIEMEFDKDGDLKWRINELYNDGIITEWRNEISEGEWEFSAGKDEIEIDWESPTDPDFEVSITRLTNKEFEGQIDTYILDIDGEARAQRIKFEAEKD
tara:strand:- start:569 stop:1054 length:486 start_codon:yes stop_codon:yes gene_type:complete